MAEQPSERDRRLQEALIACLEASERGQPNRQALLERYAEFNSELNEFFANQSQLDHLAAPLRQLAEAAKAEALGRRTIGLEDKGTTVPLPGDKIRYLGD